MPQKIISISYLPIPLLNPLTNSIIGEIFRPIIPLRIAHNQKISYPLNALVDSGADRNLFPAELGESLGIEIKKGKKVSIGGIGDVEIKAYTARVSLFIYTYKFETEVDFSYQHQRPILGRNGFFNLFKSIKFKERERFLDIEFNK